MSMLDICEMHIGELSSLSSHQIASKFRLDKPVLMILRYSVAPVVTMLLCSPRGKTWRTNHFEIKGAATWMNEFTAMLENERLYQREIAASKVRRRSLPDDLFFAGLPRHAGSYSCESPQTRLCSWFLALSVHLDGRDHALDILEQWISQLGEYIFIVADDARTGACSWQWKDRDETLANHPDLELFSSGLWAPRRYPLWQGSQGIAARLFRSIEQLERTGMHGLKLGEHGERHLCLPRLCRGWLAQKNFFKRMGGLPDEVLNIGNLDLMYSAYARFTNVLDDPYLYRDARWMLDEVLETLGKLPLSPGLPFDPVENLQDYIHRQERRFPVLKSLHF